MSAMRRIRIRRENDMTEPETPELTGTSQAASPGEPPDDARLARAEAAAAREAAAEAAAGSKRRAAVGARSGAAGASGTGPAQSPIRARRTSKVAEPDADARSLATLPAEPPRSVSGETISVAQGGIQNVVATNVDLRQGAIGRAQATDIAVSQGGVGIARADRVSVELGGVGAAIAGEIRITQGGASTVLAREVHLEQSVVRSLIANNVHAERTTGVLFLVARRVEGDVRTLLDWRGALAFGAALGVVSAVLRGRLPRRR
jgi:hypothetical protein